MRKSGTLKFLKRAAVVILLLLLIFWGFLEYRQYSSYQNVIHKNADLIVKVSSDQIVRKVIYNAVSNPAFYFKPSKEDTTATDEGEDRSRGFVLPANVFIYTLKDDIKSFYTSLQVNDSSDLKAYLRKTLSINSFIDNEKYTYASSDDEKTQIAFNNDMLALAYSFDQKDLRATLEQILFQKEPLNSNNIILSTLKEAKGDVVVLKENDVANIDFNNGNISFSGILNLDSEIDFPSSTSLAKIDTSATVHLSLSGDVPAQFLKSYVINDITIPLDSLTMDYTGHLDLMVSGTTAQYDTIVTYDYNDDFEKVEVKTVSKNEVPGINILVKGKASDMMNRLKQQRIAINDKLNRSLFPLLDLKIIEKGPSELIFSNMDGDRKPDYYNSTDFFTLYTNFHKLDQQSYLSTKGSYLKKLDQLNVSAARMEQTINVKGQILLNEKDINALLQLIGN